MLSNLQFLDVVKDSFKTYLSVGTSRSTAKLKSLHGSIARDLEETLGGGYTIQSQGYGDGHEGCINGRYYPKNVDITIRHKGTAVAGYAVKFVMHNYSQNSNNYFENMLGETANLRANSVPYFQIFIIFDKVPYFKKGGEFSKYDIISEHNLDKYLRLSTDDPGTFFHTPDKTLVILINLKERSQNYQFKDDKEYNTYYASNIDAPDLMRYSTKICDTFGQSVILNNYSDFIMRTGYIIKGRLKDSGIYI